MWKNPFTTTEVHAFEPLTYQYLQPDLRLLFFFGHQVPAALLTFAWDAAVQADIAAAGGKSPTLLKPELLESIRTMSWAPSRSVGTPHPPTPNCPC